MNQCLEFFFIKYEYGCFDQDADSEWSEEFPPISTNVLSRVYSDVIQHLDITSESNMQVGRACSPPCVTKVGTVYSGHTSGANYCL